jgi:hypothetical protein
MLAVREEGQVWRPRQNHAPMRVLPHIKPLDDCFGDFHVRVVCECGACREIQPQALARLFGGMRCSRALAGRAQLTSRTDESGQPPQGAVPPMMASWEQLTRAR